jgi:hypothetical protein
MAFLAKLTLISYLRSNFRDVQFWHRNWQKHVDFPLYVPFWNRKILICPVLDTKMLFKNRLFLMSPFEKKCLLLKP